MINMIDDLLELGHVLLHPIRFKIVKLIRKNDKLYVNQMAEMLNIDRKLISFHLSTLNQYGFVKSEYEILEQSHSKGKAAKYYQLTNKVDNVLSDFISEVVNGLEKSDKI